MAQPSANTDTNNDIDSNPPLMALPAALLGSILEHLDPRTLLRTLALVTKHPALARGEGPEDGHAFWTGALRRFLSEFTPADAWFEVLAKQAMRRCFPAAARQAKERLASMLAAGGAPDAKWGWQKTGRGRQQLRLVPASVGEGKSKADFLACLQAFACARCRGSHRPVRVLRRAPVPALHQGLRGRHDAPGGRQLGGRLPLRSLWPLRRRPLPAPPPRLCRARVRWLWAQAGICQAGMRRLRPQRRRHLPFPPAPGLRHLRGLPEAALQLSHQRAARPQILLRLRPGPLQPLWVPRLPRAEPPQGAGLRGVREAVLQPVCAGRRGRERWVDEWMGEGGWWLSACGALLSCVV